MGRRTDDQEDEMWSLQGHVRWKVRFKTIPGHICPPRLARAPPRGARRQFRCVVAFVGCEVEISCFGHSAAPRGAAGCGDDWFELSVS